MAANFKPDHAGLAAVLKSAGVKSAVHDLAERVASEVRAQDIDVDHHRIPLPVKVDDYETDRAASSVVLAHPAGQAVQAKYGVLTKAAASVGLEITEKR